jgi:molybdopterin/thiamine biosynthesis adenylyltransferase
MIELTLDSVDANTIREHLISGDSEGCALLYANETIRPDGTTRLLVGDFQFPKETDYTRRGLLEAELNPAFVAHAAKRAQLGSLSLVFVHSHPGSKSPQFSAVDDEGEQRLSAFLAHRCPGRTHAAVVISRGGMRARRLGGADEIRVIALGPNREVLFDPNNAAAINSEIFDRQVRAFGAAGQRNLESLRVAVVGLGGTGSIIAQELVHLGVRRFILIDADTLESTNLNRIANATPSDLGSPKVEIAERYIKSVAASADVISMKDDIIYVKVAKRLLDADIIFGCTDSHGSRAVLQQISYQYFIPCIDMGTTIVAADGHITYIYGRVQLLSPGLGCFNCSGLLNPNEVRRDMMTAFERQADPYLQGAREPAPAVMSINGTVASLAVTMLLSVVCGIPGKARHLLYNGITSVLRTVRAEPSANCYVCSRSGAFARADSWPLFGRQD